MALCTMLMVTIFNHTSCQMYTARGSFLNTVVFRLHFSINGLDFDPTAKYASPILLHVQLGSPSCSLFP